MKKIFAKKIFSIAAIVMIVLGSFAASSLPVNHIRTQAACAPGDSNGDGDPCDPGENMFNCKVDCLPAGIPTKPFTDVLGDATKWLIGFALMISVTVLVWGGMNYISSSGDPQKAETAKKLVKYSLIGIGVVGISYAIIVALDLIFT